MPAPHGGFLFALVIIHNESMESINGYRKGKATRPLGIWLVTIYTAVFMGLNPMLVNLRYYFGTAAENALVSPSRLIVSVLLAIALIVCAIGTWFGSSRMRYGLVLAVLVQSGVRLYQNIQLAGQVANLEQEGLRVVGRIIGVVVVGVIIVAYLLVNRNANRFLSGDSTSVPTADSI